MQWLGDYKEDDALHFLWSTNDADGASVTRTADGTVHVYKDNAAGTETQAGVTDTEDFDGLVGIHACDIDLSADAFYAVGADYTVVLKAATIDGQTVNAVLAHFSIENRFAEVALSAQGKLDVNAEVDTALTDIKLDHLIAVADGDDPVDNSIIAMLAATGGDWSTFVMGTDSLQAIRGRGDAAWIAAIGFSTHTAANVRDAILDDATRFSGASIAAILADVTNINGDAIRGTNNSALASICTEARLAELDAANLPANIDNILADTGTDGVVIAAGSKTGYALSAAAIDAILDEVVEGTTTFRQMLRLFTAALAGKSSGGGTTTLAFRNIGDSKNRILAVVDEDGNRTTITLDGT